MNTSSIYDNDTSKNATTVGHTENNNAEAYKNSAHKDSQKNLHHRELSIDK